LKVSLTCIYEVNVAYRQPTARIKVVRRDQVLAEIGMHAEVLPASGQQRLVAAKIRA
jgi:hypothetical protein